MHIDKGGIRMKQKLAIIFCALLVLTAAVGCSGSSEDQNIVFTAVLEEVAENSILVTTTDEVGFDMASVHLEEDVTIGFELMAGQTVKLTIKPEIAESYPVQVTAVAIELIEQTKSTE